MNIIYISKINPFPPYGGENIRAYNLIKTLSGLAKKLDVIVPCKNRELADINNINIHYYPFKKMHLAFPFYREKALVDLIGRLMKATIYDFAVLDYSFYGQYIQLFKEQGVKVIYGTHNSQAELILSDKRNFLYDAFSYLRYQFSAFHEKIFFNKADFLLTVSDYDTSYHSLFVDKHKIIKVPNFLDENLYTPEGKEAGNYIVYSASFDSFQNKMGAIWFFKEVWDKELSDLTHIKLVGKGSDKLLQYLKKDADFNSKNVFALGKVIDIKPFIKNASAALVPLLEGSGTRLKCLEAMALKTQVVTTSKGAEGIDQAESIFFIADSPLAFKNAVIKCISHTCEQKVNLAYDIFMKNYSVTANSKLLGNLLNSQG